MNNKTIETHTALRGIAAAVVLNHHLGDYLNINAPHFLLLDWPGRAVDFFFILSGFILNYVYLSA